MRNNQRIFIFLFTFFIVVALGSLFFLGGKGSAFDKSRDLQGSATAVLSQMITGLKGSEKAVEQAPSDVVETVVENENTEPETKEDPEVSAQEPVEEQVEEPVTYEVRYFTFVTDTQKDNLRMRTEPSESGQIITSLKKYTFGYVLKPDNNWCRVTTEAGTSGYCSTQYLILTEVTRDDFPSEYQERVEAPDEELSEKFGN